MKKKILFGFLIAAVVFSLSAKAQRTKKEIDTVRMAKMDPLELGSGTFRMKKVIKNELEVRDFSVMLYPRKGTAAILYKKMPNKERLSLDADGRRVVIDAFDAYLKDFEEKKLDKRKKKSDSVYGAARAKIEWGPFQYSSYADPKITLGYVFVGNSPYFCIKIPTTESTQNKGDTPIKYGGNVLYFNRTQGADLVKALQDEEIQNALASQIIEAPADDDYDDNGDYEEDGNFEKKGKSRRTQTVVDEEDDSDDYLED